MRDFDMTRIDDLKKLVERAEEARELLRQFAEWDERVSAVLRSDPTLRFRGMPQCAAALLVLEENPDHVFRTREVVEALLAGGMEFGARNPVTSISSCLSRAATKAEVVRMKPGRWKWRLPSDHDPEDDLMKLGVVSVGCELCGGNSGKSYTRGDDFWTVTCGACGKFTITREAYDALMSAPELADSWRDLVREGTTSRLDASLLDLSPQQT